MAFENDSQNERTICRFDVISFQLSHECLETLKGGEWKMRAKKRKMIKQSESHKTWGYNKWKIPHQFSSRRNHNDFSIVFVFFRQGKGI